MPISILIVAVLGIIVISYRQTIRAYPNGGGSYIVAKENLGTEPGLVAAAALLTDYVLTVSVSVAAGVAAITSAFPGRSTTSGSPLGGRSIVLVMLINLRGVRESGTIFADPDLRLPRARCSASSASASAGRCSATPPHVTDVIAGRRARPRRSASSS